MDRHWQSRFAHGGHQARAGLNPHRRQDLRLSIQYHEETSYVLSGRVLVSQGESVEGLSVRELGPGESWRNTPRLIHTLEAIEDAQILEGVVLSDVVEQKVEFRC